MKVSRKSIYGDTLPGGALLIQHVGAPEQPQAQSAPAGRFSRLGRGARSGAGDTSAAKAPHGALGHGLDGAVNDLVFG